MYLWKCWRDTRIKFFVFLGLFVCLQSAILLSDIGANPPLTRTGADSHLRAMHLHGLFLIVLVFTCYVILFVGWVLGEDNAGADIGRGSGDFLLTRPSSRWSFVWSGWTIGMAESLVLWLIFSTTLFGVIFFQGWQGVNSRQLFLSSWLTFCKLDLPILFLMLVINLGLVYGLTYCIGIVMRSGARALIGSAALIFGYQILKSIFLHRFHVSLPEFLLPYNVRHGLEIPAIHSFAIRGTIAIAFPVLAHFVLERTEI